MGDLELLVPEQHQSLKHNLIRLMFLGAFSAKRWRQKEVHCYIWSHRNLGSFCCKCLYFPNVFVLVQINILIPFIATIILGAVFTIIYAGYRALVLWKQMVFGIAFRDGLCALHLSNCWSWFFCSFDPCYELRNHSTIQLFCNVELYNWGFVSLDWSYSHHLLHPIWLKQLPLPTVSISLGTFQKWFLFRNAPWLMLFNSRSLITCFQNIQLDTFLSDLHVNPANKSSVWKHLSKSWQSKARKEDLCQSKQGTWQISVAHWWQKTLRVEYARTLIFIPRRLRSRNRKPNYSVFARMRG